jgi:hypothetical protein
MSSVLHRAGILTPYILGCKLDVEHGGMDLRMPHQVLQGGQRDAGADHIGSEGVAETMRIGVGDRTAHTMVAEQ